MRRGALIVASSVGTVVVLALVPIPEAVRRRIEGRQSRAGTVKCKPWCACKCDQILCGCQR